MKRRVFYSFHYKNDVLRVQQIRQMGVIDGDAPVSPNVWETVKRSGSMAIRNWIDENMKYKDCVVVLIGSETASREWVLYEIDKAWREKRGLIGIYIHNLKDPNTGTCIKGDNPFDYVISKNGYKLSNFIKCYDPDSYDAYGDIRRNLSNWVEIALAEKNNRQ